MQKTEIVGYAVGAFMLATIICSLRLIYVQSTLTAYLNNFHFKRWEEITSIGGFSGMSNPFSSIPYVFDRRDMEDPILAK